MAKRRCKLLRLVRQGRRYLRDYGPDTGRFLSLLGTILRYLETIPQKQNRYYTIDDFLSRHFGHLIVPITDSTYSRTWDDDLPPYVYNYLPAELAQELYEDEGEDPQSAQSNYYYRQQSFDCAVCDFRYRGGSPHKAIAWQYHDGIYTVDVRSVCRWCHENNLVEEEVPVEALPSVIWRQLQPLNLVNGIIPGGYGVYSLPGRYSYAHQSRNAIATKASLTTLSYSELKGKPFRAINDRLPIQPYSASPFQVYGTVFVTGDKEPPPKNNRFYGVELEMEILPDSENPARAIWSLIRPFGVLATDSSLRNGFEVKTLPATMKAHRQAWGHFFDGKPHRFVSSWASGRCGMHVHVSADSVSPLVLGKMNHFFNSSQNWAFISTIAGRSITNNIYCLPMADQDNFTSAFVSQNVNSVYRRIFRKPYQGRGGRREVHHHQAFVPRELGGKATYEFRIFRGNLAPAGFFKNLEFVDALLEWCVETAPKDINHRNFQDWLIDPYHAAHYRNLAAFLQVKGIYKKVPGRTVYLDESMTLGGSP